MEADEPKESQVSKELDKLFYEVGTYTTSADYRTLLNFVKNFPHIAPYNALLLHIQKPGSVYVATPEVWKEKFNRTIKPGARPLIILWPFGPVRFVFELGDTEGAPLPQEVLRPFNTKGRIKPEKFDRLMSNLPRIGVSYHEAAHGTGSAGYIQLARPRKQRYLLDGKRVNIFYHLVVNENHSPEEKFATIAHELGHLLCWHLTPPVKDFCPDRSHLDLKTQEFEAESVAWLVCERAGIHSPSAQYLNGYLGENKAIPHISLELVFKAAGLVESMLTRQIPLREGILVKDGSAKPPAQQGSLL